MDWCHTGLVSATSIMNQASWWPLLTGRNRKVAAARIPLRNSRTAPAEYGTPLSELLWTSCYQPRICISEICCKQLGVDVNSPKASLVARACTAMRIKFWWRFAQVLPQMIPRMSGGGGPGIQFWKNTTLQMPLAIWGLGSIPWVLTMSSTRRMSEAKGVMKGVTSVFTGFASCTFGHLWQVHVVCLL